MPVVKKLILVKVDGDKILLQDPTTGLLKISEFETGSGPTEDSPCCCDCSVEFAEQFADCFNCSNEPHWATLSISVSGIESGDPPFPATNCSAHACHLENLNSSYSLPWDCSIGQFYLQLGPTPVTNCSSSSEGGILVWEKTHCGGPTSGICFNSDLGVCDFCDCDVIDEETCECICYGTEKAYVWGIRASISCHNFAPPESTENMGRVVVASVSFDLKHCSSSTSPGHCDCAGEGFYVCSAAGLPVGDLWGLGLCGFPAEQVQGAVFLPADCATSGRMISEGGGWKCGAHSFDCDPSIVTQVRATLSGT